jgi:polyhydroxyalkanoate synthesis regulator phasin
VATKKHRPGYIEKFLKRADSAIDDAVNEGIKRSDKILEDAVQFGKIASKEAKKKSIELKKQAKIESRRLKSIGEQKIDKSVRAAKKIASTNEKDLETLAKLGELRKAGIITEKEFQTKKKQILKRI